VELIWCSISERRFFDFSKVSLINLGDYGFRSYPIFSQNVYHKSAKVIASRDFIRDMMGPLGFSSCLDSGIPDLKAGSYDLNLTRVTFPPLMPSNPPHHRSGAALYYILSGTGANTIAGTTTDRGPGSLIYEPSGLVHQWGNPGVEPLSFLAFNINPEGTPAVVPETPPK
jgi:mannose-6-phosphate isomerase-like protein (cupin superfamily)